MLARNLNGWASQLASQGHAGGKEGCAAPTTGQPPIFPWLRSRALSRRQGSVAFAQVWDQGKPIASTLMFLVVFPLSRTSSPPLLSLLEREDMASAVFKRPPPDFVSDLSRGSNQNYIKWQNSKFCRIYTYFGKNTKF
jgi:hypothetical protein